LVEEDINEENGDVRRQQILEEFDDALFGM
jgi:hypothetical protein